MDIGHRQVQMHCLCACALLYSAAFTFHLGGGPWHPVQSNTCCVTLVFYVSPFDLEICLVHYYDEMNFTLSAILVHALL